jgi:hypothetical protein
MPEMQGGLGRRLCANTPYERRTNHQAAVLVELAVIYSTVFGRDACRTYFALVGIAEPICTRIFAHHCRRRPL